MKLVTVKILLFFFSINAMALPNPESPNDPVAKAVFASEPNQVREESGQKGIGIASQHLFGWGFVFQQKLARNKHFWGKFIYRRDQHLFLDPYKPTNQVAHINANQKHGLELGVGLDWTYHLTDSRFWGVVVGAGVVLSRDEYQSRFHPQICGIWCGFDPDTYVERRDVDISTQLRARFGVAFRETQVAGVKGDLVIALEPTLLRYPQMFVLNGPDGREFNWTKYVPLMLETYFEF